MNKILKKLQEKYPSMDTLHMNIMKEALEEQAAEYDKHVQYWIDYGAMQEDMRDKFATYIDNLDKEIRNYLWCNHAHKNEECQPYGDDGEMQCCGMDFKRIDIVDLIKYIYERRMNKAIDEPCHICKKSKDGKGSLYCSYPHPISRKDHEQILENYKQKLLETIDAMKNGINEGWGGGSDAWNALAILDDLIREIKEN